MESITLTREETSERMLGLAVLKGYKPTKTVDIEVEMLTTEAEEQDLPVSRIIDETKSMVITGNEEVPNEIPAKDFLAKYYQELIDSDIEKTELAYKKTILKEKQIAEEKALEEEVKAEIGTTKII